MSTEDWGNKLSDSMEKNKELFIRYTKELVEIMVKFCLLALDNLENLLTIHFIHLINLKSLDEKSNT